MNLRKVATYTSLGFGAIVAFNRSVGTEEPLDPPLDGEVASFRWRGIDIEYTTAGDPGAQDLVLLHGISAAATAGEWRTVFESLAADYHVIAPDLPGFGRSDRPPIRYSPALYEDFIHEFLGQWTEPVIVSSSLTGAYTANAVRNGDVSGLVLICPTDRAGPQPPKLWVRELLRSPVLGEALFNLLVSKPALRYFNADHGYVNISTLTDEWIEYEWQTAHQPNARFAPASFASGYLNAGVDLEDVLSDLAIPITMIWGRESEVTPLSTGRDLADAVDARLVVFDDAKLLPHVEYPDQFLDVISDVFDSEREQ